MTPTDPMLPFWFLTCTLIGFFIGYAGGKFDSRKRRHSTNWKRP